MSIGQRLKSAREAKGLTLEDAARTTKVQRKILVAIEQDRVEEHLDPIYAKIFLKKYVTFLGLEAQAFLGEYLATQGPLPERPLKVQTELTKQEASSGLPSFLVPLGVVGFGLIGVAFCAYLAVDLYGTLQGHSMTLQGRSMTLQGHPMTKDRPARSALSKSAARTVVKKTASPAVRSSAGPKTVSSPSPLLVPRSQMLKLSIRPKADVWMQVKSDGVVIFQNVLNKGAEESWTAKEELELWTGNAAASELFLNGKPLESLGSGVKKGIKVTRRGVENQ